MSRQSFILAMTFAFSLSPALAGDAGYVPDENGQVEFVMPSGNIGCIYTPQGGTPVYMPRDGREELACDRVEPSYIRALLGPDGEAEILDDVGDASCCGADNVLGYGETWSEGAFTCTSDQSGLTCETGDHGFTLSRRRVEAW